MEEGFEVAAEGQDHEGFQDDHSYDENGQLAAEEGEVIEGSRVAVEIQGREVFVGYLLCEADGQISFMQVNAVMEVEPAVPRPFPSILQARNGAWMP